MASTIKYHYALDEKGTLTSVEDVRLEDRINHRYTCLGCGVIRHKGGHWPLQGGQRGHSAT